MNFIRVEKSNFMSSYVNLDFVTQVIFKKIDGQFLAFLTMSNHDQFRIPFKNMEIGRMWLNDKLETPALKKNKRPPIGKTLYDDLNTQVNEILEEEE